MTNTHNIMMLEGRLCAAPQAKAVNGGTSWFIRLAVRDNFKSTVIGKDGKPELDETGKNFKKDYRTQFLTMNAYTAKGKDGVYAAKNKDGELILDKGARIAVVAHMTSYAVPSKTETNADGSPKTIYGQSIVVDNIQLVETRSEAEARKARAQAQANTEAPSAAPEAPVPGFGMESELAY